MKNLEKLNLEKSKKSLYIKLIVIIYISMLFVLNIEAQVHAALDNVPHDISYYRESKITKPLVKVLYGRPSTNGEKIFGNKVSFGEVWRTGANEATEIKFYKDVVFGTEKVKAGTYVLYSIPGENEWELILSSNTDVLGAFQYDPVFNVATVKIKPSKAEDLEVFSIFFKKKGNKIQMVLGWESTRIKVPISIDNAVNEQELYFTDNAEVNSVQARG